jgi:hypothetical protein
MAVGSELPHLGGYPFEVRYSDGALVRARAAADVAAEAYSYFDEPVELRLVPVSVAAARGSTSEVTAATLAPLLTTEVSRTLGRAVRDCARRCDAESGNVIHRCCAPEAETRRSR